LIVETTLTIDVKEMSFYLKRVHEISANLYDILPKVLVSLIQEYSFDPLKNSTSKVGKY
jgi:hypothetical protein